MTAEELYKKAKTGDPFSLSRLVTLIENNHDALNTFLRLAKTEKKKAPIFGITGPPGAGKSTITDRLIVSSREGKKNVGVFCVDPSSPFSGGAILGDRIRMLQHADDKNVFIRSLGTRGRQGGLSACTFNVLTVVASLGFFDVIYLETVGVGQTELDIMTVADVVVVVLVPESGDTIQVMKAGLMEVGQIFVVNKSDRPQADLLFRELQNFFADEKRKKVTLFKTNGLTGEGINSLHQDLFLHGALVQADEQRRDEKIKFHLKHLVVEEVEARINAFLESPKSHGIINQVKTGAISVKDASNKAFQEIS